MQKMPKKILIIRNDKIGDFTLSLPTFALLKACLPDVKLHALVPEYTRPIAEMCPYIDQAIIDPGADEKLGKQRILLKQIKAQSYDCVLSLYSTTRTALICKLAGIPQRYAPATKIAQIFQNRCIKQRRSQSAKPEYQYNLDIARQFLADNSIVNNAEITPPYLSVDSDEIKSKRLQFCQKYNLEQDSKLIFIHPGCGGSANNISVEQFSKIADKLNLNDPFSIIISSGPNEADIANNTAALIKKQQATVYISTQGLDEFIKHIAFADCFISGSTGPLHIAGALNRPCVGFYPNRQSATSLRWQTLSDEDRRLSFSPIKGAEKEDMSMVDIEQATIEISAMLNKIG